MLKQASTPTYRSPLAFKSVTRKAQPKAPLPSLRSRWYRFASTFTSSFFVAESGAAFAERGRFLGRGMGLLLKGQSLKVKVLGIKVAEVM